MQSLYNHNYRNIYGIELLQYIIIMSACFDVCICAGRITIHWITVKVITSSSTSFFSVLSNASKLLVVNTNSVRVSMLISSSVASFFGVYFMNYDPSLGSITTPSKLGFYVVNLDSDFFKTWSLHRSVLFIPALHVTGISNNINWRIWL